MSEKIFKGFRQIFRDSCIFASVAGVLRHIDEYTQWDEKALLGRYNQITQPSFGSFLNILGPDLEQEGFKLKQITRTEYNTKDKYYNFIRKCLEDGITPILSREIYINGNHTGWHMITVFKNTTSGFMVHDVADGSQREITEQEFKEGFVDNFGRELRIHKDFDTFLISK